MKRILFFISILMLLFSIHASAQNTASPDTVCARSSENYNIPKAFANFNSQYTWGIKGSGCTITFGQSTDSIRIAWVNSAGSDTLWVVETNAAGCKGDTVKIKVVRTAHPTAAFENATRCFGETLNIRFTGSAPYSIQYTLNDKQINLNGIVQNPFLSVKPKEHTN
jgi:hypothetical protein